MALYLRKYLVSATRRVAAFRIRDGIMTGKNYYWRTISFTPETRRVDLRMLLDDDRPQTVPVVGWLTQEQVDDSGSRTGVAAVRVIAGVMRHFADDAAAAEQEKDGWLATEVIAADEDGWHVFWPDGRS
jgi:hypothetical protein